MKVIARTAMPAPLELKGYPTYENVLRLDGRTFGQD